MMNYKGAAPSSRNPSQDFFEVERRSRTFFVLFLTFLHPGPNGVALTKRKHVLRDIRVPLKGPNLLLEPDHKPEVHVECEKEAKKSLKSGQEAQ